MPTTNFNFEFALGEGRFSRFGQVADAEDYLLRFPDSAARESVDLPHSPLALPAVLDYLGLLLSDRVTWGRDRRLVQLPDFVSASLVTQLPTGAADFEQRLSALWSVIGRFDVPKAEAAKYEARGWDESRGSINSFEIWLGDHVPEFATSDQCAKAIRTIRNIGTLRQGAQHSSAATRGRALRAQAELGLPMVIIDYPAAWSVVLEALAAAFYSICLGLTLAASS